MKIFTQKLTTNLSLFAQYKVIMSYSTVVYIDAYLKQLYDQGIRGLILIQLLHSQNVVDNSYEYVRNWLKRTGKVQQSKYISTYIIMIQKKLSI